ncbi:hypothetical protein XELAEV_18012238mg [Xenopus laevis]|uniref:Uncharacterized protein n=1 Tax=Xenopus laevis TaxID=8355 RepID=A0A974HY77_XENLA|nr:hypothetical protein XELAEV_18012238mg [Xenopus laevis]
MSLGIFGLCGRPTALCIRSIWSFSSERPGSNCCNTPAIKCVMSVMVSGTPLTRKLPLLERFSKSSTLFSNCAI